MGVPGGPDGVPQPSWRDACGRDRVSAEIAKIDVSERHIGVCNGAESALRSDEVGFSGGAVVTADDAQRADAFQEEQYRDVGRSELGSFGQSFSARLGGIERQPDDRDMS